MCSCVTSGRMIAASQSRDAFDRKFARLAGVELLGR
jgi:hypothetical protein